MNRDPFSGESPDYVYTNVVSPDKKYAILHIPFSGEIKIDEKFNIKGIMKTPGGTWAICKFGRWGNNKI